MPPTGEVPVTRPGEPRVTISGAEVASDLATPTPLSEESLLPHWTEAPTGQIPAVLRTEESSSSDDPWSSIPAATWREGEADWTAHEEQFDASMLADPAGPATGEVPASSFSFEPVVAPLEEDEAILDEAPRPEPTRQHRTRRPAVANPLAGRAARPSADKNVSLATFTGVVAALIVCVVFALGAVASMVLVTIAVVAAVAEAYAALRKVGVHPATLLGLLATATLSVAAYNKGEVALGLVTVLFIVFAFLWYLFADKPVDILDGLGATVFVYVWIGVLGSYAALLLSPINYPNNHGVAFLFGAIFITVINDTGALFVGRAVGRRPLARSISPGKTVEGAVGGAVVSVLLSAVLLPFLHPWTIVGAVKIALAIAVIAPLGDLFESEVKRSLGLKDMGEIMPGHGGVLDRVDGLLFALPTTYYLVHFLHIG
jgi:phosphatidate cytidylyltransferase